MKRTLLLLISVFGSFALAGCSLITSDVALQKSVSVEKATNNKPHINEQVVQGDIEIVKKQDDADLIKKGSGVFVNAKAIKRRNLHKSKDGSLSLNFEKTDIKDVVKTILGELLNANYIIDPNVSGTVSITTNQMVPEDSLLPALEMLLEMNGAALLYEADKGFYRVIPEARVKVGSSFPTYGAKVPKRASGKLVHIVQLQYIAADEMKDILSSFNKSNAILRADSKRNILTIAGNRASVNQVLEIIELFDINQLAGASTGIFAIKNVDAKNIVQDLGVILEKELESSVKDIVKVIPLERINSVLVISTQFEYINNIRDWIKELDKGAGHIGRKLYVYQVQNGLAKQLSELLNALFDDGNAGFLGASSVDPKENKATISRSGNFSASQSGRLADKVKILADEVNNALIIMATEQEFRLVSDALKKLDVMPLQVLVEASIVEVSLTGDLQYGLQWFFNSKGHGIGSSSGGILGSGKTSSLAQTFPGFNFSIVDSANSVRALLSMLASESKLNVISSPSIMVLNNQQAEIVVGDQVPVVTRQSVDSGDNDALLVNEVQFRDTGIQLTVTPRVNSGGLVTMTVSQEVSDAVRTTTSGLDTPTIQQRKINSSVAVQNGQTIVLGGLIRENKTETESGIPVLYQMPIVGSLFGQTVENSNRTELLVLITPKVISTQNEVKDVTNELRKKLRWLELESTP